MGRGRREPKAVLLGEFRDLALYVREKIDKRGLNGDDDWVRPAKVAR